MTVTAHCKINLTMEVLGKRADGYHNIRSVMQFLDLGDRLEIEPASAFTFWCDDPALCGEDNLAVRAYRLLASRYPVRPVAIRLYKQVPYMSGMGGGSADAAAVLCAVNELSELGLSQQTLMELGRTLGADVPPCLVGGLLLAEGIGERVTPLRQTQPLWFCIIKPVQSFSTPAMYCRMDESAAFATEREQTALLQAVQAGDAERVAPWLCNSFEPVALPSDSILYAKRALLETGAIAASMTGAGSAVFGLYRDQATATDAFALLRRTGVEVYLCRSVAAH